MTLHLKPSQTNQPSTEGDHQKLKPFEKQKMRTGDPFTRDMDALEPSQ